jgi:HD superfamily phosphohydrolase YqeK
VASDISDTEAPATHSYLPQVLLATTVVAVLPSAVVWALRARGIVDSYILSAAVGVVLSLLGSHLGRAFWQKRPGSRNLLFNELMIWGYMRRRYIERRLSSARSVLGALNNAQSGISGGLSAEHQAKLLEQFARALDARDPKTYGHSRRVARYSWMIAKRMNLGREQVARIRTAAAIHDIGKIDTPDEILNKAGSLTDEEYATMKLHAADGARMSLALHDELLTSFVRHHHERLDASGYPDGLSGTEIPIGSKIIAVADTFDALTANRSYRNARTHQQALAVLNEEAGTRLDAGAVRAFCAHYNGRRGLTVWGWLSSLPERAFEQLSSAAAGVGTAAKAMAVAALAGGFATTTATFAKPPEHVRSQPAGEVRLARDTTSTLGSSAAAAATTATGAGLGSSAARLAGHSTSATAGASLSTAPGQVPGAADAASAAAGQGSPSNGTGSDSPGSSTTGSGNEAPRAAEEHHGKTGTPAPSSNTEHGQSGGGSSGPVRGTVENVTGVVGHVGGKVEEVAKGTVEEVKGKAGEVKGKVEEVTKTTVEQTKGKVEEVKGKVEEVAKSKIEETKGKVEETVNKLKKVLPLP